MVPRVHSGEPWTSVQAGREGVRTGPSAGDLVAEAVDDVVEGARREDEQDAHRPADGPDAVLDVARDADERPGSDRHLLAVQRDDGLPLEDVVDLRRGVAVPTQPAVAVELG